MRYMFLIYSNEASESAAPVEARRAAAAQHRAVMTDARGRGVLRGADPLKSTATATTIRSDAGRSIVTDGPFAETKEQLAGYYIIECRDLDEAIEWARRIPTACQGGEGCIEIRPIHEMEHA
jgi:hypothetical protein